MIQVTDPAAGLVIYTYDANGNRTSMTDPNGNLTSYIYDALNRRTGMAEPLGHITSYGYDEVGNLSQKTDPKGQVMHYSYDAVNRQTLIDYPSQSDVTFSYDSVGNLLSMTDGLGTTNHSYNLRNQRTSTTDPFDQVVGYGYDANGNRTGLTYPGGKIVSYVYDAANNLTTVTDWLTRVTSFSYDKLNRLLEQVNANGTSALYFYDPANRLTGLINDASYGSFNSYFYNLDPIGNILDEYRDDFLSPTLLVETVNNTHDAENRLTASNGVLNTFDANGNLTVKGSNAFVYDITDRLLETTINGRLTRYQYDGLGNRYSRTRDNIETRFVLDTNTSLTNVLMETDATGNPVAYNVYGHGLIKRILPDNSTHYYHYDSHGSTVALSDENQTVTDRYAYDPFGKLIATSGVYANPFRYLGRHGVLDEDDNLNYIRARYYDTDQQRFVSKDTYLGEERRAQTLNRYAYAINSPVRLIDITGYSPREIVFSLENMGKPTNLTPIADKLFSAHSGSTKNIETDPSYLIDAYSVVLSDKGIILELLKKAPVLVAKIRVPNTSLSGLVKVSNFAHRMNTVLGVISFTADSSIYLHDEISSNSNIDALEAFQLMAGEMAAAPLNVISGPGRAIGAALVNHALEDDPVMRERMLGVVEEFRLDGREVTDFFDKHNFGYLFYEDVGL